MNENGSNGIRKTNAREGIEEYRLENGLKILLRPQHAAPVVAFMVLYRVGSRNEAVGHTGATHLLEHMMFKGTPRFNPERGTQIASVLRRIGANFNATTWYDRTNYFEAIPKDELEVIIELEADRMRNSLIRDEDRESERIVVRNELERGENEPLRMLDQLAWSTAFREHPYHHPTIGWRSDVECVPTARLREFYNTFYYPNNATAILAGDFETGNGLRLIAKHFGALAPSPASIPEVYTTEPPQEGERRFILRRAGELGLVMVSYRAPDARHPDSYPLSVLARILSEGVTTRLYQKIVDGGLAISIGSFVSQLRDPGLFQIYGVLNPGVEHARVEEIMRAELKSLQEEGVSEAELSRAKIKIEADIYYARDGALNTAFALGESESCVDWQWFLDYVPNILKVSGEDIRRVAAEYFKADSCTVGWFIPASRNGE
ncbi:MAG: insulinase family protein [Acidobacteria bacterium]|nr:insulinase family protein [Acidobacteriota bacterium]